MVKQEKEEPYVIERERDEALCCRTWTPGTVGTLGTPSTLMERPVRT